jgi:hypothetical protein
VQQKEVRFGKQKKMPGRAAAPSPGFNNWIAG